MRSVKTAETQSSPVRDKTSRTEQNRSTRHAQFMELPQQTHKQVIEYASPNDYQTIIKTSKYLATLMKTKNDHRMREIEKNRLTETSLSRFVGLLVEYTRWKKIVLNVMYIQKFIKKTPFEENIVDVVDALLQNKGISKIQLDVLDICLHVSDVLKSRFSDFLVDHASFFIRHISPSVLKKIFHLIRDRKKRDAVVVFFLYEGTIHNRLQIFRSREQALRFLHDFLYQHDRDFPSLVSRINNATVLPKTKKSR